MNRQEWRAIQDSNRTLSAPVRAPSHPETNPRARLSATSNAASAQARTSECDLPSPLACFIEATAKMAGDAAQRGDLEEAKRLLEGALHSVEAVQARPVAGLHVVPVKA